VTTCRIALTYPACASHGTDTTGAGLMSRLTWLRERGFCLHNADALWLILRAGDEPGALSLLFRMQRDLCASLRAAAGDEPGVFAGLLSAQRTMREMSAQPAVANGRIGCLEVLWQQGTLSPSCVDLAELLQRAFTADVWAGRGSRPPCGLWSTLPARACRRSSATR
jgi:hypothetical protein